MTMAKRDLFTILGHEVMYLIECWTLIFSQKPETAVDCIQLSLQDPFVCVTNCVRRQDDSRFGKCIKYCFACRRQSLKNLRAEEFKSAEYPQNNLKR